LAAAFACICSGLACRVAIGPAAAAALSPRIYFTATESNGVPDDVGSVDFSCSDKIYTVVEFQDLSRERHEIEVIWRDPNGKTREHTRYPFVAIHETQRVWAWLRLHRPTGANVLSVIDSAAGMQEFIGEWSVKVIVDDRLVGKDRFNVLC